MIKNLRLLLVSALAVVCGTTYAESTTIDFTSQTVTTVSGDDKSGDGFTLTTDGYTFTAVKNNGSSAPTQNPKSSDIRLYAKNSMTVASSSNTMKQMVFTISSQGKKRLTDVTASVGSCTVDATNWTVTWTYDSGTKEVTFTVGDKATYGTDGETKAGQFDFDKVVISSEVGETTGDDDDDDPVVDLTTVANIAAFKALTDGTEAILTLSDAQVLYVNGSNIYVRDASGAIDFYGTGLSMTAGQKMNGSVTGKYTLYKNTPELAKTDNTNSNNISFTDGTAEPKSVGAGEIGEALVCDYVSITGDITSETEGNYTNLYLTDSNGDKVMVYDKFKVGGLEAGLTGVTIKGIVVAFNSIYEVCPIETVSSSTDDDPTEIQTVNNIAEFNALATGTEATLTLKDAEVLYVSSKGDIFIRDASAAIDFYKTNLSFTAGQVLNGTITGKNSPYNGQPEFVTTDNTNEDNVTTSTGDPQPKEVDAAELSSYVCDLVKLIGVWSVEDGNYYITDTDGNKIQVYDKFGLNNLDQMEEGTEYRVNGIVLLYKGAAQICPIENNVATGIENVNIATANAPVYNLAGQRVAKINQSGIYVKNGHKYLIKK